MLSNLCQCYYSIYLFDLDNDVEEAVWQEDYIEKAGEFPKGSLKVYYEKFIHEHVDPRDQEKTVSYTHLDVYKRQGRDRSIG